MSSQLQAAPSKTGELQSVSATQAKIGALRDRFDNFQSQWAQHAKNRMDLEENKLIGIKESMGKLEQTLNSEIKRRVEANKALQGLFENQIQSVQGRLEEVFLERLDRLQSSVDALSDRIGTIEREFTMTREQYIQDIEDKNAVVAKDLNTIQNAFENEKVDRKEREDAIKKKISDHEIRTQSAFEVSAQNREQKYQQLRGELEDLKRVRGKGDDKFQTFILEEIAAVKEGLSAESTAREEADDDIVQALNHYTKALQDALRIVNQH
mmetsp:Transcript_50135/g.119340  ORF Transcript_50135/g.119340 Transcript_50135/m.119340 type:complete len:267 (+) Transcript_50135:92-892(+)